MLELGAADEIEKISANVLRADAESVQIEENTRIE